MSGDIRKSDEGDRGDCHHCYCIKKNKQLDEYAKCQDHLKHWELWIERRRKVNEKIVKTVGREQGELLINASEEYRSVQEDKLVFHYTNINTNFDKYRGNPAFWKFPNSLPDKCDRSLDPTYFYIKTKEQKNEIPAIEYVGTPNYILDEKNVLPRTRNMYQLWKDCKYRKERLEKLSPKIAQIEPHKPQYENLVLIGQKIVSQATPSTKSTEKLPQQVKAVKTIVPSTTFQPIPTIRFKINDTIITKGDALVNDMVRVWLTFETYRNANVPIVQYLRLENRGLTTLRFYWRRIEKFLLFRDLIKRDRKDTRPFYFDKTELLLPPAEKLDFPVWFKANELGNYLECWEISTIPSIWGSDFHLILSLRGFVFIEGFEEMTKSLQAKLEENVRNTLIADLLRDLCNTVKYAKTPEISWTYTEEQLFESANEEKWGVEKRSKYLYDKDIVLELKKFYEEVRQPSDPATWNYSVKKLKMLTKQKDIYDYVEEQMKEAIKTRQRRLELQNILKEQEDLAIAQKPFQPGAKGKAAQPAKKVEQQEPQRVFQIKETRFNKLTELLHQLERPLMIKNDNREKYFAAFIIMRTYMFKMCDALENIDQTNNFIAEGYYPSYNAQKVKSLDQIPGRLLFENFDDIWVERVKRIPPDGKVDFPQLPKPEILNDIPLEEVKTRYKRYFNLPDTPPEVKGKGKGKDNKSDKGKGKDSKSEKGKDKKAADKKDTSKKGEGKTKVPERVKTVIDGFNPYAEEYIPPASCQGSTDETAGSKKSYPSSRRISWLHSYNNEKYLIVYHYLYEAIGAIVDALETFKENIIPVELLGGLTKCTDISVKEEPEEEVNLPHEHLEEEVINIEEQAPSEISRTSEDSLYFQLLLDSHLKKNPNTKKYIIQGQTKADEESIAESLEPESLVNLFKSRVMLVEEPPIEDGTESICIQTSDIDEEYRTFSNILLLDEPMAEAESESDVSVEDKTYSREVFYYLGGREIYNDTSEEEETQVQ